MLRWYSNPEWSLVILGYSTLVFLAWQSWETKRAARASEKVSSATQEAVRAQIAGLRPQIRCEPEGTPAQEIIGKDAQRVRVALVNKGVTPAYDLCYESWIELLPFPFEDFTGAADYYRHADAYTLHAGESGMAVNIPFRKGLTEEQKDDLKGLRLYACVRVRVSYRDDFSGHRYANFGFYVMREGFGFLPKYNDSN